MLNFDVTHINLIENAFLVQITQSFGAISLYAQHLLYYFIVFEIILSGFAWALYQSHVAERLFFQLLKVGLILFVVENYTSLLDAFLNSLLIIGDQLSQQRVEKILLNPGAIWEYGYNFSLNLLQIAATSEGFALPLILCSLGFGILLVIGIFGIQICIQVIGFYLVRDVSLLMMPLAVFTPLRDFFSQSIRGVMQAGIRLMVQLLIVSVAVAVWGGLRQQQFTTSMNINGPLGLLFSGMLFVFASAYLPKMAAKVVGTIQWQNAPTGGGNPAPVTVINSVTPVAAQPFSAAQQTSVQASMSAASVMGAQGGNAQMMAPAAHSSSAGLTQAIREEFSKQALPGTALRGLHAKHERELERQREKELHQLKQTFQEMIQAMKESTESRS